MILAISIATSVLTALGMWLLGQRNRLGFAVSSVNQVTWLGLIWLTGAWGLLPLAVVMLWLNWRGWRKWGKATKIEGA